MRDPEFEDYEDFIDMVIAKGHVTEDDENALWHKTTGISSAECRAYLAARLAEKKRIDKENAREEAEFEKRRKSTSGSKKQGGVKTCPNCGAVVQGGNAKCPECGFAFMDVDAVSSAQELDRRLRKIVGTSDDCDKQRAAIVSSFPIPNTREDLFEFMASMEPKAFNRHKEGDETALGKAYYEKFVEAVNKAIISFPDDPTTEMFKNRLEKDKKKIHISSHNRILLYLVGFILVCLIGIGVVSLVKDSKKEKAKEEYKVEMQQKAELTQEYEEWKASIMPEIEAYAEKLDAKFQALPTPNAQNYMTCISKLSGVVWKKNWPIPGKYEEIVDYSSRDGAESDMKEEYNERIESYKKLIGAAWTQSCQQRGLDEWETRDEIPSEYR